MKKQRFKIGRLHSALAGAVAVAGIAGLGAMAQAAVAPAGDPITNQASVTYEDSVGNPLSALSNNASVIVAQIYSATIGSDSLGIVGAPGSTVNYAHTITNNGNGTDIYHIVLAQGAGDSGDYTNIEVRQDGGVNCAGSNGQTDAGETVLTTLVGAGPSTEFSTISIAAGQTACIAVSAQIPAAGVIAGNTFDLTVEARAEQGTGAGVATSVGDITDGNGAIGGGANGLDGLDGTNNNRMIVTADAVLEVTKSATPDFANRRIAYNITVRNTGAASARDVVIFDGLPENTTLLAASVSAPAINGANDYVEATAFNLSEPAIEAQLIAQVAAFTAAGDVLVDMNGDGDELDADEAALGMDLNRNTVSNTTDGTVQGVFAFDDELAPGAVVEVNFTVEYSAALAAGYVINNRAHVSGDSNNDADSQDAGETPETPDIPVTVPQTYAVDVNEGAGDTDGDQADGSDTQTVTTGPEGGVVILNNVLTNQGNGTDRLELNAMNDGGAAFFTAGGTNPAAAAQTGGTACVSGTPRLFPTPINVTYWNTSVAPAAQLTNTNASAGVDTGPMAAGATMNIEVRIALPTGTNGLGDYCASMQVTSAGDASVVDYKLERLGEIIAPAVDLANDANFTVDTPSAAHDAGGTNADVHTTGATQSIVTQNANPGDTVTFNLYVQNEGLTAESYNLGFGGQWNNAITAGLPAGFTVTFDAGAGDAITTGSNISSTGLVPPGGVTHIVANVVVPASASATTSNYVSDSDGDTVNETINGGLTGTATAADGDGDYPVFFTITGTGSGAVDVVLNAIDVAEVEGITVTADQTGQIEQGGTIVYPHNVSNNGNTVETVQLTSTDTHADFDPSTIRVDTNNDGTVDNIVLAPNVVITLPSGNVTVGGTAAAPTIVMQPGDTLAITTTVSAQTVAGLGTMNNTVVTATYDVGVDDDTATATDVTTVVTVQVSSTKTAARDADCMNGPDEAFSTTGATATAPGECVYWQIIVDNSGTRNAFKTVVTDNLSAFTEYQANSLESCTAQTTLAQTDLSTLCGLAGGTYCAHTDAVDNEGGCASGVDADGATNLVHYYLGTDDPATGAVTEPDGATAAGGILGAGQKVTVRFRVRLSTN